MTQPTATPVLALSLLASLASLASLAACSGQGPGFLDRIRPGGSDTAPAAEATPSDRTGEPLSALTTAPPPPVGADTAEELDTTTAEERRAVLAAGSEATGARLLGETVTSLGDPTEPGFWMETPLVGEVTQGKVENPANGKTVTVELRPSGGTPGSGSRLSLAAFRLLGADLRSLPVLKVFAL